LLKKLDHSCYYSLNLKNWGCKDRGLFERWKSGARWRSGRL